MKETKPWVKPALEIGPVLLFFAVFMLFRDRQVTVFGQAYSGFIFATLIFVPVLALSTFLLWRVTGKLSPMQIATLALVILFGGLSVWLNDPRFFKMKPTLIYLIFAIILAVSLLTRRNWLQLVLSEALPMDAEGWHKLTWRMMLAFVGLALANEIVWRTMSETTWVYFKTFGLPLILMAFLMANAGLFRDHALDKDSGKE